MRCARRVRDVEFFLVADHHLAGVSLDLDHVKRRTRGHAKALALTHGEVVDAAMLANDFAVGRDQLAGSVGQRLALLGQIGVEKLLVVAAGNESRFPASQASEPAPARAAGPAREPPASSFRPAETGCG